jgi:hypothetical protein
MDKKQKILAACIFGVFLLTVAIAIPSQAQNTNSVVLLSEEGFCEGELCPPRCRWTEVNPQLGVTEFDNCSGTAYLSDSLDGDGKSIAQLPVDWDVSNLDTVTCSFGFTNRHGNPRAFCHVKVNQVWFSCDFVPAIETGCTIDLPEWGKRVSRVRIRATRLESQLDLVLFGGPILFIEE